MPSTRAFVRRAVTVYLSAIVSVFYFCITAALAQMDVDGPFGLSTVAAPETPLTAPWEDLLSEIDSDLSIVARCRAEARSCASPAALKFLAIVREGEQHELLARIGHINRAANLAMRLLGKAQEDDEWRSPLAALVKDVGDCKHYAVLKYAALREAGFAPVDLKIVIVEVRSTHEQHAVVAVRIKKHRWLLLDDHTLTLVDSAMALDHYDPRYELDQNGTRRFALPSHPPQIADSLQRAQTQ